MANEFIARKGLIALDDTQVTGSISVSSTASLTAVSISNTLSIPGFANVSASLAAAVAGGDNLGNHTATQNLNMGGYSITNALNITASGNISASGFIGDLTGTATTASYAITASYAENGVTIINNTDNYIVTATGTTGTLNGEASFRIDSGELSVGVNGYITFTPGDGGRKSGIHYDADADFETTSTLFMGTTVKVGATLSTTAGKLYNLSGSWAEADANSVSTSTGFLGVALDTDTTNTFLTEGMYNLLSSQVGGTYSAGAPLYISETNGAVTFTPPTTSGAIVRIIGHAIDSYTSGTTWYKIYLKPSNDWLELA